MLGFGLYLFGMVVIIGAMLKTLEKQAFKDLGSNVVLILFLTQFFMAVFWTIALINGDISAMVD